MRRKLYKIHFTLVVLALANFTAKKILEISLNYQLAYAIILGVYLSGLILFFSYIHPFKKVAIYFSAYLLTPLLFLSMFLFGGIFLGIINSITLYPVYPNRIEYQNEEYTVYKKFNGFLGKCCTYEITERHFFIFEEKIKDSILEGEEFNAENFNPK